MTFWLCSLSYVFAVSLCVCVYVCVCAFLQCLNASNHVEYSACTLPLSFQALYSWSCPVLLSYGSKGILDTWKVVRFWAAKFNKIKFNKMKFKLLVFSMFYFALSRVPNTFIPAILYNMNSVFCLHNYVVNSYI